MYHIGSKNKRQEEKKTFQPTPNDNVVTQMINKHSEYQDFKLK